MRIAKVFLKTFDSLILRPNTNRTTFLSKLVNKLDWNATIISLTVLVKQTSPSYAIYFLLAFCLRLLTMMKRVAA